MEAFMPAPQKIFWDEKLRTGDPNLDNQHKALFGMFNQLADTIENGADKEYVGNILNTLDFYSEWHFSHEENCMEKHRCLVAGKNKAAHAQFKEKIKRYQREFENGAEDLEDFALRLHGEIAEWFRGHILAVDTRLRPLVQPDSK
jgi:hemerythrin